MVRHTCPTFSKYSSTTEKSFHPNMSCDIKNSAYPWIQHNIFCHIFWIRFIRYPLREFPIWNALNSYASVRCFPKNFQSNFFKNYSALLLLCSFFSMGFPIKGKDIVNAEPFPTSLSILIVPPCASTKRLQTASPNP